MTIKYDYEAAVKIADAFKEELDPKSVGLAIMSGLNKSATGIRARLTRDVGQEFNASAKAIKAALPIQKATFRSLEAVIPIDNNAIQLHEFLVPASKRELEAKARTRDNTLKAPRVKIKNGKPIITLPHAFWEPKNKYLAERTHRGKGSGRGPLKGLYAPSIASQVKQMIDELDPWIRENTQKRIQEALDYRIIKLKEKLNQ